MITQVENNRTSFWFQEGAQNSPSNSDGDGSSASIMIIDDEPINVKVARKYLEAAGFTNLSDCTDPTQAFDAILSTRPDVLILDIMMPEISGLNILERLRNTESTRHLPVVVLTASDDRETRLTALNLGASDFLAKPVDSLELMPRVRNVVKLKKFQDHLQDYSRNLEAAVRLKTAELEMSRREVLMCLARAAEFRDDDTGQHVLRVGRYAAVIAGSMGLSDNFIDMIEQAAQLHDVGKIGIPDSILQKPGKLTDEERAQMQLHSGYGKKILQTLCRSESQTTGAHSRIGGQILESAHSPLLQMAYRIALTHHERWDGKGYPIGLSGQDIPLEGRVTAIADVFDALSSARPYKKAFPVDECFRIIEDGRGTYFDPQIVDAFLNSRAEVLQIQMDFLDVD